VNERVTFTSTPADAMSHHLTHKHAEPSMEPIPRLEIAERVASLVWEGILALGQLLDDLDPSAKIAAWG
jgi:hypothetical protein